MKFPIEVKAPVTQFTALVAKVEIAFFASSNAGRRVPYQTFDAAKDALKKFGVSKEIEPGSPSPLELSIRGINAAFEDLATTLRSPGFMSPVSSPVPIASGPTYNVVVNVSGGSPEGVHEAAYSAVIQAFQELEAQLRV